MVRRVIRDVRRVVLADNTDRLSRYGTYEQQVRGPSNPRFRRANANHALAAKVRLSEYGRVAYTDRAHDAPHPRARERPRCSLLYHFE